jgi:hypothetical protein
MKFFSVQKNSAIMLDSMIHRDIVLDSRFLLRTIDKCCIWKSGILKFGDIG